MTGRVRVYEVGPRDGLQNEATPIPTATKARFIGLLGDAGLREIEATSFVAPRAIPQLADAEALLAGLARQPGVRYPVLVPNERGMDRAVGAGVDAIAVFTAASDAFTRANIGMSVDESLAAFAPVLGRAAELGWWRRGYVSTAFGCPYTGRVEPARAIEVALRLLDLGVDEVCFGDTIGVGVPGQVADADRAGRCGRDPARTDRLPLPRHARDRAGQRRSRPRCRGSLLRRGGGRDRWLPVRTGRRRQPRHRGPGLLPRRVGLGVGGLAGGHPHRRTVRRRGARTAADDEGRPGRRVGSGIGGSGRAGVTTPRGGHVADNLLSSRQMDGVVLVLNQNYEPLNVCNLPRAFRLVFGEKAEVIEYDHQVIRTPRTEYRAPSVIRLQHLIRRPRPRVKLSRREVFARDRHICQYCGRQAHDMTLDHVVPRHRGGGHTWENLVTACKPCNHRKGGKTLEEARLRLLRPPFEPRSDIYSLFTPYLADEHNEAWRTYLFLGRN